MVVGEVIVIPVIVAVIPESVVVVVYEINVLFLSGSMTYSTI